MKNIVIESSIAKEDVEEAKKIFISDLTNNDFVPTITHIIESPQTSRRGLVTLLLSAKEKIDIEIEVFEDEEMIELLSSLSEKVAINILFPPFGSISANEKTANILAQKSIQIKTLSTPYIHTKLIIVDGKTAYLGSINLTTQSLDENRELGIIVSDKMIIDSLLETFNNDWQKSYFNKLTRLGMIFSMENTFFSKVYLIVKKIPVGKVATYGQIAKLAGNPKAARAVGMAMKLNPNAPIVPCHRVISGNGELVGYSGPGGLKQKKDMLTKEGVHFIGDKVDLSKSLW